MPVFEGTGKYGGVVAGTPQVAQRRLLGGQADGVRSGADAHLFCVGGIVADTIRCSLSLWTTPQSIFPVQRHS